MATGRKAFEATSQSSLVAAILGEQPPAISALQPLSPPALDRVVKKCLAKDPDERWQTARDLADALKWISQDTSQVASSRSVAAAPVSKTRRVRLLMIAAAVVSLVAVVVAGLWVWRQSAGSLQATNLRLVSTFSGEHWGASFSPDGNFIAFLKEADGVPQVWVKNLAEGDPLQVTFGDVPVTASRLVAAQRSDRVQPLSRRPVVGAALGRRGPAHPGVWRCAEVLGQRQAPRLHSRHGDLDRQRRWQ